MDQINDLVDSISRISGGTLDESQLSLIDNLLRYSSWYPDRKDYVYIYKLYKEMKISTEAEIRLWEEKYNCCGDEQITLKISKLNQFLKQIDNVIDNYTRVFNALMNSYGDDKAKAFYLIYFKGCNTKDVARELSWLSIATINNWKSLFQKDLENTKVEL